MIFSSSFSLNKKTNNTAASAVIDVKGTALTENSFNPFFISCLSSSLASPIMCLEE